MNRQRIAWGRAGEIELYLERDGSSSWRSSLSNLLLGKMSLVGPNLSLRGVKGREEDLWWRFRPGLFSLSALRRRTGIAFASDEQIDNEYLKERSLKSDLKLVLRSLLLCWLPDDPGQSPAQVDMFGVTLANPTFPEALAQLADWCHDGQHRQVAFLNAHCINVLHQQPAYRNSLFGFDWLLADGFGVRLASLVLAQPLKDNLNGTDLFPALCTELSPRQSRVYLLGGRPGVASAVAEWIASNYPNLQVVGHRDGYFREDEEPQLLAEIRGLQPHLLLVALGVPNQELWLAKHRHNLPPGLALGVGGLLDFYSGRIRRAPQWLRELGLEWLFRLSQEPLRLANRYIVGNLLFFYRLWRHSMQRKSS